MPNSTTNSDCLIYLIRHGETDWNVENRCAGQTDIPLNAKGREQAGILHHYFAKHQLAAIYGSDLERTRHTATAICQQKDLPYQPDLRWREIQYGILEGTIRAEWSTNYSDLLKTWDYSSFAGAPPEGESRESLIQRTSEALEEVRHQNPSGRVAIFTHGGVIKALLTYLIFSSVQLPIDRSLAILQVDNASITTLRWKRTKWQILAVNEIPRI